MITTLSLENFRGFTDLKISPLKRINLIAGANNTGKTGILESLYLLFAGENEGFAGLPSVFRSTVSGRGGGRNQDDFSTFWQSLFYDRQTDVDADITAEVEIGGKITCHLSGRKGDVQIQHVRLDANGNPPASPPKPVGGYGPSRQPPVSFTIGSHGGAGGGSRDRILLPPKSSSSPPGLRIRLKMLTSTIK